MFEDAFVLRDGAICDALFAAGAVLAEGGGLQARGPAEIGRALAELWAHDRTYVARTRHVLQTRDTALVVSDSAIHVLQRDRDGAWRAAISLLDLDTPIRTEQT